MPRLSNWNPEKSNNYRYMDRIIREQFVVGGTDLYVHKYLGAGAQGSTPDVAQIQDLLFLENRDRIYEKDIIRIRGHYNVANLDFDLTQFGLFLSNDIVFITTHYNDMIDLLGRKLMVGDVVELPHLIDYHPLNATASLKRYYQITDGSYASEGFSPTWYPHLWRFKCEPLVDSQEFSQILNQPEETDNYTGVYDKNKTYPIGYTATYGNSTYITIAETPVGISPPNEDYWKLDTSGTLRDVVSTYNKNIAINDAQIVQAKLLLPLSGYDTTNLYIVPEYDEKMSGAGVGPIHHPAPPTVLQIGCDAPNVYGTVTYMKSSEYSTASPVIKLDSQSVSNLQKMYDMTADIDTPMNLLDKFMTLMMEVQTVQPEMVSNTSGFVSGTNVVAIQCYGPATGPYGTSDNTYSYGDQDVTATGFTGTVTTSMNYRADCDPRFRYIARYTPRSFGYTRGYLTGNAAAPNGHELSGAGITFPTSPKVGDYYLRIDYFPQVLFRWNGKLWVRISDNVRTASGKGSDDKSQLSGFINNTNTTTLTDGSTTSERQALNKILRIKPD